MSTQPSLTLLASREWESGISWSLELTTPDKDTTLE